MSVSIPSGISGDYEDTSDSDSVDSGDLLDYGIIGAPLAGTGSLRMDWIGAHLVADDPDLCMIGGSQGGGQFMSDTRYSSLFGGGSAFGNLPRATGSISYDVDTSNFANFLTDANGAATFTLLIDDSPSDLTMSATSSGYWIDTEHSVAVDVDHTCANSIVVTSGTITWASAGLLLEVR